MLDVPDDLGQATGFERGKRGHRDEENRRVQAGLQQLVCRSQRREIIDLEAATRSRAAAASDAVGES